MTAFSAAVTGPVGDFSRSSRGMVRGFGLAVGVGVRFAARSESPPPPQPERASRASARTVASRGITLSYARARTRISARVGIVERNWAGNHADRARELHRPASLDELRELLARTPRIRVLGTRHSFNAIADSDELVSLERLPAEVTADRGAGTVSVPGGMSYGALAGEARRPRL